MASVWLVEIFMADWVILAFENLLVIFAAFCNVKYKNNNNNKLNTMFKFNFKSKRKKAEK